MSRKFYYYFGMPFRFIGILILSIVVMFFNFCWVLCNPDDYGDLEVVWHSMWARVWPKETCDEGYFQ